MSERRKITAAFGVFDTELRRLIRLDDQNQRNFYVGPGRPSATRLSASQMHLLTEALFARAFSKYELYMEEIFLLYCRGKPTASGKFVKSYISPKSHNHARSMLKSGMQFLEWNSADKIIERAKVYLENDNPIYLAVTSHQARLNRMRKIRNAIAHASEEAEINFRKVVRDEIGVAPLTQPNVGEFLLMTDRSSRKPRNYLRSYFEVLENVAQIAAG